MEARAATQQIVSSAAPAVGRRRAIVDDDFSAHADGERRGARSDRRAASKRSRARRVLRPTPFRSATRPRRSPVGIHADRILYLYPTPAWSDDPGRSSRSSTHVSCERVSVHACMRGACMRGCAPARALGGRAGGWASVACAHVCVRVRACCMSSFMLHVACCMLQHVACCNMLHVATCCMCGLMGFVCAWVGASAHARPATRVRACVCADLRRRGTERLDLQHAPSAVRLGDPRVGAPRLERGSTDGGEDLYSYGQYSYGL